MVLWCCGAVVLWCGCGGGGVVRCGRAGLCRRARDASCFSPFPFPPLPFPSLPRSPCLLGLPERTALARARGPRPVLPRSVGGQAGARGWEAGRKRCRAGADVRTCGVGCCGTWCCAAGSGLSGLAGVHAYALQTCCMRCGTQGRARRTYCVYWRVRCTVT